MNRTALLLVSAAVLCAVALTANRSPTAPKAPAVAVAVAPAPIALPTPQRSGALALTAQLSSQRVLAGSSTVYAKLDLSARALEGHAERVPVNLAVAIDHSGSMSNGKMEQAKRAAISMIDQLRVGDRLAIIAFDDTITTFPSTAIDEGSKARLRAFVDRIFEAGSTNISGALEAAYAELRPWAPSYRVSRVVLLSDGQPTAGVTNPPDIARLAERSREQKMSTSAFGVGLDYNAALMSDLANRGGGGYRFIENASTLDVAFANELGDASQLLARDVRVSVEVPEGVTIEDVPGHVFTRSGRSIEVPLYDFGPGQTAQLLVRMTVNAPSDGAVLVATAGVRFTDVKADAPAQLSWPLTAVATSEAPQVTAESNAPVLAMAKTVDLATQVQQAQAAYERGDTKSALDMMASVRRVFGMSADALAGDESVLEANWRRGGDAAKRVNLELTNKTMRNFGQNNTY